MTNLKQHIPQGVIPNCAGASGSDGRSLELPAFNGRVQFLVEGAAEITLQGPGGTYTISL